MPSTKWNCPGCQRGEMSFSVEVGPELGKRLARRRCFVRCKGGASDPWVKSQDEAEIIPIPSMRLVGETFLPASDAGLEVAGVAHDRARADAFGRQPHDLCVPDVLCDALRSLTRTRSRALSVRFHSPTPEVFAAPSSEDASNETKDTRSSRCAIEKQRPACLNRSCEAEMIHPLTASPWNMPNGRNGKPGSK
jgi:hypothetical protein